MKKRKKEPTKRMNLNVPMTQHNKFKAACAGRGEKMTDVLITFIKKFVRDPEGALPRLPKRRRP